jgi:hypothetical protein
VNTTNVRRLVVVNAAVNHRLMTRRTAVKAARAGYASRVTAAMDGMSADPRRPSADVVPR